MYQFNGLDVVYLCIDIFKYIVIFIFMDYTRQAQRFKALGDQTRLRILNLLPVLDQAPTEQTCGQGYNVSELAKALKSPQPTVSHHLKVLFHSGLVKSTKRCRDVYYWVDQSAFESLSAALKKNCTGEGT